MLFQSPRAASGEETPSRYQKVNLNARAAGILIPGGFVSLRKRTCSNPFLSFLFISAYGSTAPLAQAKSAIGRKDRMTVATADAAQVKSSQGSRVVSGAPSRMYMTTTTRR